MLETKEQKQIFGGCIILIIILGVVSIWHRPNFTFKDTTNYQALQQRSVKQQKAYDQYLAALGTTAQAQVAMADKIFPPEQVKAAVFKALKADQDIKIPALADEQIKISSSSGKVAVKNYLAAAAPIFDKLKSVTDAGINDIYNPTGDPNKIDSLIAGVSVAAVRYQEVAVPKEAVLMHKQLLIAMQTYADLLRSSKSYTTDSSVSPWPQMYKDFVIMDKTVSSAGDSFRQLNVKYNLLAEGESDQRTGIAGWLIPTASAQIATVDIWAKAQEAINEAIAVSVARFMLAFIDELTKKVEQAYRISNFLYYTDALVSGQYVDDYLTKYVADPLDQALVKNFIPELSCGNSKNLNSVFQAKADQYLGFDPSAVDPKDPDYYTKLAKVGDFMASTQGWDIYYKGVAGQAQSAAEKAANNELNSTGYKAARDVTGGIITPVDVAVSTMRAAFTRYLSEGRSDKQSSAVEKITSQITQSLLNNFVFQGTVLKEQKVCLTTPVAQLLTPVPLEALP